MAWLVCCCNNATAQSPPVNFHHLTVKDGLNDGIINGICKDKYGYIWLASLGALNRFNGTNVQRFTHVNGDSASAPNSIPYSIACSADGRLWIGYDGGLTEFEYSNASFKKVKSLEGIYIFKIVPVAQQLYLATARGLLCYDVKKEKLVELLPATDATGNGLLKNSGINDIFYKNGQLYLAARKGYLQYDIKKQNIRFVPVPALKEMAASKIMLDNSDHVWISNIQASGLLRIDTANGFTETFDHLLKIPGKQIAFTALDFIPGNGNEVWMITAAAGLLQYDINSRKAIYHRHNEQVRGSISSDMLRTIYKADDGNIWISGYAGVDYFDPSKSLFGILLPFPGEKTLQFARGIAEDHAGNFWFTTGEGISRYNPADQSYRIWQNQLGRPDVLYHNSARAIVEDDNKDVWIATARGINVYRFATGEIGFMGWKDSIPPAFYYSANKDNEGTIWFGTKDYDGLYYYKPAERKFYSIAQHPVLKQYRGIGARYVFQDSRQRLWIGFNGSGLVMYDPKDNSSRHWFSDDKQANTIAGNTVIDIKEDKKGIIWISTFSGITGIDADKNNFLSFTDRNGLRSNLTCGLAVDPLNRLWISGSAGLAMLDSSRKYFTYFDESDGLTSSQFSEHAALYAKDGDIIMPSLNGYIRFDPLHYRESKARHATFICAIKIFNKPYEGLNFYDENLSLSLAPGENFFTIEMEALNFTSADQTWFAYKLEGFDKDWHYTQDPKAVYTNVPGGEYSFLYKSTSNINEWNVPAKTVKISIATVFYKAAWFWVIVGLLLLAGAWMLYRYRSNQQKQVFLLKSKAQALQKEKAMVMYESLKQQLNPHFLFNSLTSLNSLIQSEDSKTAAHFLNNLSKTYRYILKSRDNETVSLGDEIKFAENYVQLQKTRFEKGFEVQINIPEEYHHRKIVPVTLQNLLENAIKHNIIDEESPLVVTITADGNDLFVTNNLQKKKFVETSNRQGLTNLRSLYAYLSKWPVEIIETQNYFTVKLPLL